MPLITIQIKQYLVIAAISPLSLNGPICLHITVNTLIFNSH